MAKIYGGRPSGRPPALRGAFYVRVNRGRLVVCAWPRKRGKAHAEKQKERWAKFRAIQRTWYSLTAEEAEQWRNAVKGTPLLPRDAYTAAQYGRLWYWTETDGTKVYPMAAALDVSGSLDVLEQRTGALLVRGVTLWQGLLPGPAGTVLTSQGPGLIPTWQAPAAGGGGTALPQPQLTDYTETIHGEVLTYATSAEGGIGVRAATPASGSFIAGLFRTLPAPPWRYRIRLKGTVGQSTGVSFGLLLAASTTGDVLRLHVRHDTGRTYLTADKYTNPDSFGTRYRRDYLAAAGPVVCEAEHDGSTLTLRIGTAWDVLHDWYSASAGSVLSAYGLAGFGFVTDSAGNDPATLHVDAEELV